MVTKWGLSDRMGPLSYSEDEGEIFLGGPSPKHNHMSDETINAIDDEVRSLIDRNYARCVTILNDNIDVLHAMTEALMKYETIDRHQIKALMERKQPPAPADWKDDDDSSDDDESVSSTDDKSDKKDDSKNDDTVGNPAGSH
jgi:cell division protease FtsH